MLSADRAGQPVILSLKAYYYPHLLRRIMTMNSAKKVASSYLSSLNLYRCATFLAEFIVIIRHDRGFANECGWDRVNFSHD